MNNVAMYIGKQISLGDTDSISFVYKPRGGIPEFKFFNF
jgi:hypothetical protein